jgi:hypothetical protein
MVLKHSFNNKRKEGLGSLMWYKKILVYFSLILILSIGGINWSQKVSADMAPSDSVNFEFTGDVQSWTVPFDGKYRLETWGAEGGSGGGYLTLSNGGKGGYSVGEVMLNASQILNIYIGGMGESSCFDHCYGDYTEKAGGWNGGAGTSTAGGAGGGGGATDIRSNGINLNNRIIVAGGGGGAGWNGSNGGDGGGLIGGTANRGWFGDWELGKGGSQASGGSGYESGSLGLGGRGQGFSGGGGGGGGGYYGGGGGHIEAGGGGSSYIDGLENGQTASGVRQGNGAAKITLLERSDTPVTKELIISHLGLAQTANNNALTQINAAITDAPNSSSEELIAKINSAKTSNLQAKTYIAELKTMLESFEDPKLSPQQLAFIRQLLTSAEQQFTTVDDKLANANTQINDGKPQSDIVNSLKAAKSASQNSIALLKYVAGYLLF